MSGLYFIRTKIINKKLVELSEKLGITMQAVSAWEKGKKKIPKKRLEQLVELTFDR
jgi:transcriptional regulator with XRE-family HTH domain